MPRHPVATTAELVAVATLIAIAAPLGGCGILNGLFWDAEVTDAQLCTSVTALDDRRATCEGVGVGEGEGGGAASTSIVAAATCDNECLRGARATCTQEWQALVTCLLDDRERDCSEISGSGQTQGFCGKELEDYLGCGNLDLNNCPNSGGPGKTGCNGVSSACEASDDPQLCSDCCSAGRSCGVVCGDSVCHDQFGESDCPDDCGASPSCNNNNICEPGENDRSCGSDCDGRCNHDHNCTPDEALRCDDCNGVNPDCNNNSSCDNAETVQSCPSDCESRPCSPPDNVCEPSENNSCGDCVGPCNHNGFCDSSASPPETPTCDDCSGGPGVGCGDSICRNDQGENDNNCPQDCGAANGTCHGPPNNVCETGENNVGCPADCFEPCNHNDVCDNGEFQQCGDCGRCSNSICDGNETPASCPDDCNPRFCLGGNPNGICELGENQLGCGADCTQVCDHNSTCDGGEDPARCDDCTGAASCNQDGVCNGNETHGSCNSDCEGCVDDGICGVRESQVECADCSCNHNSSCDGDVSFCADCASGFCASDADCSANVCSRANQALCQGPGDANCAAEDQSGQQQCTNSCSQTTECPTGQVCLRGVTPTAGTCERARCSVNDPQSCPQPSHVCAEPAEMIADPGAGVNAGFCLVRDCDPLACPGPSCSCVDPLPRCTLVRDLGGGVSATACTGRGGTSGPGLNCAIEADCGDGATCAGGTCRLFCANPGTTCGPLSHICQPIGGGAANVGTCPP